MNTKQIHKEMKSRGNPDITYLGRAVDDMIWNFMEENKIPGLTLAIVQAPYIPRVVGYGVSDVRQKRLASVNTMWPVGPISQAYAAVALMQLYEKGLLDINKPLATYLPDVPKAWSTLPLITLLRHASGIADYRKNQNWQYDKPFTYAQLISFVQEQPLAFEPGTAVELSATNLLLITEIIERVSQQSYHDFVQKNQIEFLKLKHTGFAEDLPNFPAEDVAKTDNVHQLFKTNGYYIDPTEAAQSYNENGQPVARAASSALKGFSDIWASAQDVSFWDIGLAGGILIHSPENRALVYSAWKLPNGEEVPAVAGWQFYHHRGLMDIKGSIPGYSSFLSRFTHSEELVCVTLLANKEGIDFTNLGRRIAGAFGDLLSTNYDDNKLFLYESQFPAAKTITRLEEALNKKGIPLFAKFDHSDNAKQAGLELRPTTVLVFGSPKVGTGLMQIDQSFSLELPLRIAIWEDESGSTWLAFPRLGLVAEAYGLQDNKTIAAMEALLEKLVEQAGSIYTSTYTSTYQPQKQPCQQKHQ